MNPLLRTLVLAVSTATLSAQQQATTLWHLAARAHAVVVAEAMAATDPSPDWHRVEFRGIDVLKGEPGTRFSLLEPAGRCCGNALFAVVPGQRYVLFLARTGQTMHPLAGDRGVESESAELVAHVRALLQAAGPEAAARELAVGVAAANERIAQDAALALAAVPVLPTDERTRDTIREALAATAMQPTTALPALAATVARFDSARAAEELVPFYLAAGTDDAARAIAHVLDATSAAEIAQALAAQSLAEDRAFVRAAELMGRRPDPAAIPVLQSMLGLARHPRASLAATEALLAHGTSPEALQARVAAPVLELAVRRHAARDGLRLVPTGARR